MGSEAKIEGCTSFQFYHDSSEVERGVQLPDGRIVPVFLNGALVVSFDQCLDLEKQIAYPVGVKVVGLRTLNDWLKYGGKEVWLYDKFNYDGDGDWYPEELLESGVEEVQSFFAEHGYHVTKEAIMFCFNAWYSGAKSGYRDEANGYHLFTPCGWINPLSFRLSSLDSRLEWQTTYGNHFS